jgi:hypothetical protein
MIGLKQFLSCVILQIGSFFSATVPDKRFSKKPTEHKQGILFTGGYLQHHLVDEMLSVFEVIEAQDLTGNLAAAVVNFAQASLIANKDCDVVMASRTLDVCWAILDFTRNAGCYAHRSMLNNLPIVALMIEDTAGLSSGVAPLQGNSVEAVKGVVMSFVIVGYCLGKLVYETAHNRPVCDFLNMDQESAEQLLKKCSLDPSLFFVVYEYAKNIPKENVALMDKAFFADVTVLHGVEKLVSSIAKESLPIFLSCVRKGMQSLESATISKDLSDLCTEEVSALLNKMQDVSE